ncbi:glycosyltransferase family 4 protein [Anaeromicropila herbilytica]|uniref:Putative glycosyltransferase EpsD n=1 Tax=Anaeromicropila herbilytica TaxID=2785025 RepID=A0A7R7EPQ4_9FIRM|nr:glycosyltransferase family 4 protein [Anaeromicropila herbilytica]BCN32222.1 putative glycosyltransferase EpsD [Anaeromicropila herbilytica]
MKKALMLSSVASMIDQFNMQNINILMELGYEVHVACNFKEGNTSSKERVKEFQKELRALGVKVNDIPIPRSIYKIHRILKAYIEVKRLASRGKYDIVHCHSPIGGVVARLAFRKERQKGTKVIYTAHGFHFYKGAPLLNWLIFYPIEKLCAKYTDCLITINKEDYERARSRFKGNKLKVVHLPGIGIDVDKIENTKVDKEQLRKELRIPKGSKVILTVAELSKRKNYECSLKAFAKLDLENVVYVICGRGKYYDVLNNLIKKLNIENKVIFTGYRTDIHCILHIADVFIFPSYQEGLPVAVMEAMAAGLPVICSNIRGNNELVIDNEGGYLFSASDSNKLSQRMKMLLTDRKTCERMKNFNKNHIISCGIDNVNQRMKYLYDSVTGEKKQVWSEEINGYCEK